MEIRVLGCSGSKTPARLLTSFLVNGSILMDAGSAAQVLDLEAQARITDIFVSHPHLDHIADIAFIADNVLNLYLDAERPPILVHALGMAVDNIKKHLFNGVIWPDFTKIPSPLEPVLRMDPLEPDKPSRAGEMEITAFEVNHGGEGAAGYLLHHGGKLAAYTGDTGPDIWPETLAGLGEPVSDLIVEVSFPNEMKNLALLTGHLTPELLKVALRKLPVFPNVFVTHVKTVGEDRIREELAELFRDKPVRVLFEGDVLNF